MSDFETMLKLAKSALKKAYAPYSNFHVGSCVKSANGNYYSGCNVENASYGMTICAESNAIGSMIAAGDNEIAEVLVLSEANPASPPCGACRQRIIEFAHPETPIYICNPDGLQRMTTISELLPDSFTLREFTE